jgi:CBS domain-containing protein
VLTAAKSVKRKMRSRDRESVSGAWTNRKNPASKATPMNVSLVMRRTFATIKPEASLLEAAHLLLETNQRGLPVIDSEGTLVGIISEGDFLHRVELDIDPPPGNWLEEVLGIKEDTPARRRMQARIVSEAMSRNPICVSDETTLDEVVALMDMRHVAQFPVVCGTTVVGIIGRFELLRAVAHALRPGEPDGSGKPTRD